MKNNKNKYTAIHIVVILAGLAYLLAGAFSSAVWFDEEYSVGLVRHNLTEMIEISIHDVHPPMYYIILKLFTFIAGNSVAALRIFSVICTALLSLLGLTHIRKDFGEKTGLFFSILVYILPCTYVYSLQIRMYTVTPLLVTLAGIYGYRLVKEIKDGNKPSVKNIVLFVLTSVTGAYCHWYGLACVGIINLIILFAIMKDNIKLWLCMGIAQTVLYIPGFLIFMRQAGGVKNFWISISFPQIIFDMLGFNVSGESGDNGIVPALIGLVLFIFMAVLFIKLIRTDRKRAYIPMCALIVYFGTQAVFLLASIIAPIYYVRYTMVMYGFLVFAAAYLCANVDMKKLGGVAINYILGAVMAVVLVICSIKTAVNTNAELYDSSNFRWKDIIAEKIQEDDIIAYDTTNINAAVFTLEYPQHTTIFYNRDGWGVDDAYRAFGKKFYSVRNLDMLDKFNGRIWLINSDKMIEDFEKIGKVKILDEFEVNMRYKNNNFVVRLLELKVTE
ncbi:MAG: glycosyltransferase family 39 protein [Lachnospiraceae bacterium]